jgi:hypothetical protein
MARDWRATIEALERKAADLAATVEERHALIEKARALRAMYRPGPPTRSEGRATPPRAPGFYVWMDGEWHDASGHVHVEDDSTIGGSSGATGRVYTSDGETITFTWTTTRGWR